MSKTSYGAGKNNEAYYTKNESITLYAIWRPDKITSYDGGYTYYFSSNVAPGETLIPIDFPPEYWGYYKFSRSYTCINNLNSVVNIQLVDEAGVDCYCSESDSFSGITGYCGIHSNIEGKKYYLRIQSNDYVKVDATIASENYKSQITAGKSFVWENLNPLEGKTWEVYISPSDVSLLLTWDSFYQELYTEKRDFYDFLLNKITGGEGELNFKAKVNALYSLSDSVGMSSLVGYLVQTIVEEGADDKLFGSASEGLGEMSSLSEMPVGIVLSMGFNCAKAVLEFHKEYEEDKESHKPIREWLQNLALTNPAVGRKIRMKYTSENVNGTPVVSTELFRPVTENNILDWKPIENSEVPVDLSIFPDIAGYVNKELNLDVNVFPVNYGVHFVFEEGGNHPLLLWSDEHLMTWDGNPVTYIPGALGKVYTGLDEVGDALSILPHCVPIENPRAGKYKRDLKESDFHTEEDRLSIK